MPSPASDHVLDAAVGDRSVRSGFWTLAFGSIGVVYGDIGTSPLYALKESLRAAAADGTLEREEVFGIVSLILWALMIIVTAKYVLIMLRADNDGEGGTLTLMALAQRAMGHGVAFIPILGVIGAALFYGDAVITPAISVLSALEGIKLVAPTFDPCILPLSLAVLTGLFVVQNRGTARVAAWFSPLMVIWFGVLGLGGLVHIVDDASIVGAINPLHGARYLANHGSGGLVALGSTFLAVTGAEALYADMGHFGRRPIETAWLALVFPCLILNYLGQGALVLSHPETADSPFFHLYPDWTLLPMVLLATAATIIASQAVISGAYSLTQQAIQLGLLPRMEIRRTSETERGQIYVPRMNWLLLTGVVLLVVVFKTSDALAAAYGIAVTGTMVISAIMAFFVIWRFWNWSPWTTAALIAPFLVIDLMFLMANLLKVVEGGWIPLAIGASLAVAMLTWRRGSRLVREKTARVDVPLCDFIAMLEKSRPAQVKGAAVFLTGHPDTAPTALLHNLKHNKVLHERNVILHILTEDTPWLADPERVSFEWLSDNFCRVTLRFGYMERPNVPRGLTLLRRSGIRFDIMATSFFLSRRVLRLAPNSEMPRWQDKLFIWLARSANDASEYFQIPTGRAVEVGTQITV